MHYLAVLVVPLLMLADYYLTLWGAVQRERSGYGRVLVIENYELNPRFQVDIAQLKWLNPRHLVMTLLSTAFLVFVTFLIETAPELTFLFDLFIGFLYTLYLVIIGAHLGNLLTFRYFQKHPEQLTGVVRLEAEFTIEQTRNQLLIVLLPLVAIAFATQSFFVIGCVLSVLRLMVSFTLWQRRARAKAQRQAHMVVESKQAG